MYELQDRLATLHLGALGSLECDRNNILVIREFSKSGYHIENENDNYFRENGSYWLPPPIPFRNNHSLTYSRSVTFADAITYNGNGNKNNNNDESGYDDESDNEDGEEVDGKITKKGLLKQIFCLPIT